MCIRVCAAATAARAFVTRDRSGVSVPPNDQERSMTTASVYMFNQTNLTAAITINNGNQIQLTGTSDSSKWVAQTSVQTFQTPGTVPGNFNAGTNVLLITLGN